LIVAIMWIIKFSNAEGDLLAITKFLVVHTAR